MAMNRDTRKHERVEAEPGVRERRGERVPIHVSIQVRGLREDNSKVDEAAEAVVVITSVKIVRWILFSLRSEEHTSELQSRPHLVCRLLLEKKKKKRTETNYDVK